MSPIPTSRRIAVRLAIVALLLAAGQAPGEESALAGIAGSGSGQTRAGSGQTRPSVVANQRFSEWEGRAGLCDVYLPDSEPPAAGHPVIIVVHGGGWISGDKWTLEGYCRILARHGFVAIAINYRLAPAHKFPAQVDDVRQALVWASENAMQFSIDLDRLGIFGYSAGGHLSVLVASLADESIQTRLSASLWPPSDARWQKLPAIRAVCVGGPPCDFRSLPLDNSALSYFLGGSRREKPDAYVAASPTAHVSKADPVTQIIHGDSDMLVPIDGSRQFHQAQLAAGIDSRLEVMPNQGHMVTFLNPKTSEKVTEFFREVLLQDDTEQ